MWKSIFDLTKRLLLLAENTDRNRDDIKELQRQMKEMTLAIERLVYEVRRVSDKNDHEREKVILRLENELLKFARRLPAGNDNSDDKS